MTAAPVQDIRQKIGHHAVVAGLVALVAIVLLGGVWLNSLYHSGDSAQIASLHKQVGELTTERDETKAKLAEATAAAGKTPLELQHKVLTLASELKDAKKGEAEADAKRKAAEDNLAVAQKQFKESQDALNKANAKLADLGKTAEPKVVTTEAPAPKPEIVAPPAPKPEEKADTLWNDFDETSRLTVARQIYSNKCSTAAPEDFGDKTRQMILGAASQQEVRDNLECSAVAPAPAQSVTPPVRDGYHRSGSAGLQKSARDGLHAAVCGVRARPPPSLNFFETTSL